MAFVGSMPLVCFTVSEVEEELWLCRSPFSQTVWLLHAVFLKSLKKKKSQKYQSVNLFLQL